MSAFTPEKFSLEESDQKPTAGQVEKVEKVETSSEEFSIDPAIDAKITRKFDKHVVPWLFGLWLLAFIDRSNIGNARIDGLATDLKLDGNKFNIALAIFYVPYIFVDGKLVFSKRKGLAYFEKYLQTG